LSGNERREATIRGIYTQTQRLRGFIKYAVKMGSGVMICIPSFIKIGSGIQKLMGSEIHRHRRNRDRISLLQKSRLIKGDITTVAN
jgi:hypothetical protein